MADHRRAALTAADGHAKADAPGGIPHGLRADVVDEDRGAVDCRPGHRDLELARQEREFRMERGPLPDQLAPGARVDDLVVGDSCERVARRVPHAVAGGLDRVHLDLGELRQDLGRVLEARPVELDVLAGREVPVTSVILAGDVGERAQLARRQQSIRDRHAQHRCMLLDVEAVFETQRPEFVLGQLAREEAPRLIAELRDAAIHEVLVEFVVAIHPSIPPYKQGYRILMGRYNLKEYKVMTMSRPAITKPESAPAQGGAGVILFAHGARDARWAEPFGRVAEKVRAGAGELAGRNCLPGVHGARPRDVGRTAWRRRA